MCHSFLSAFYWHDKEFLTLPWVKKSRNVIVTAFFTHLTDKHYG
ncbi:hypothetical protein HL670_02849 [Serratia plymuthica]|nr:hypothetical protein HL670_02849 [Serratia plymuthica]